jgi:hypothetical protein
VFGLDSGTSPLMAGSFWFPRRLGENKWQAIRAAGKVYLRAFGFVLWLTRFFGPPTLSTLEACDGIDSDIGANDGPFPQVRTRGDQDLLPPGAGRALCSELAANIRCSCMIENAC